MTGQSLIAFDQWLNATFFGGWADETISARAHRNSFAGKKKWVIFERWINKLFFWQEEHCREAYLREVARLHMPPMYRTMYNTWDIK